MLLWIFLVANLALFVVNLGLLKRNADRAGQLHLWSRLLHEQRDRMVEQGVFGATVEVPLPDMEAWARFDEKDTHLDD